MLVYRFPPMCAIIMSIKRGCLTRTKRFSKR